MIVGELKQIVAAQMALSHFGMLRADLLANVLLSQ